MRLPATDLARSAASGVSWTGLSGAAGAVLAFVQTAVLARILEPADFGLAAAAMVLIGIAAAFADAGLAGAVIARQASPDQLSSLYWFNWLTSLPLVGAVLLAIPLAEAFFDQEALGGVIVVVSLTFLVAPLGQQFEWLLQKALEFRALAVVQTVAALVGTVAAIGSALLGAGVYALVLGHLVSTAVVAVGFAALGWRRWPPRLRLRWGEVRGFLDFGLYQMGERTLNSAAANVDYALIGRVLGPGPLGLYSIGYGLAVRPLLHINPMLNRVAFPVLARRGHDDGGLRAGYVHVVRIVAYVTLPLLAGLAVLAAEFVHVVLGPQWAPAVATLQVLCAMGALKSLANPVGPVLLARDRADLGFTGNLAALVLMVAALLPVVQEGILAVAWAYLAVTVVVWAGWLVLLRRLIGLRPAEVARALAVPVVLTATTAGVMLAARGLLPTPEARLVVVGALGAVTYAGLALIVDRRYLRDLWALLRPPRAGAPRRATT